MSVSGCTACQAGGFEALQAYDRAYQARLNEEGAKALASQSQAPAALSPPRFREPADSRRHHRRHHQYQRMR